MNASSYSLLPPVSCLLYPVSCLLSPVSFILSLVSCLLSPLPCLLYPFSTFVRPCLLSFISSFISTKEAKKYLSFLVPRLELIDHSYCTHSLPAFYSTSSLQYEMKLYKYCKHQIDSSRSSTSISTIDDDVPVE